MPPDSAELTTQDGFEPLHRVLDLLQLLAVLAALRGQS
jgi:hypothetical protein